MSLNVIVDKNAIDEAKKHLMDPLEYYRKVLVYLRDEQDYDKVKYLLNDLLGTANLNKNNIGNCKEILCSLLRKRIRLYEEILCCFDEQSFDQLYLALALVRFSIDKINYRSGNAQEELDLIKCLENDNKIFQTIEKLLLPLLPEKEFIDVYTFLLSFLENPDSKKYNIYLSKSKKNIDPIFIKICHYVTGIYIKPKKETIAKKEKQQEGDVPEAKSKGAEFAQKYLKLMRNVIKSIEKADKTSYDVYRDIFIQMMEFWSDVKESKKVYHLIRVKEKYVDFLKKLEEDLLNPTEKIKNLEENINTYLRNTKQVPDFDALKEISKIRIQTKGYLEQLDIDKGEIYKTDFDKLDDQKLTMHKEKYLAMLEDLIKRWEQLIYKLLPELNLEESISIVPSILESIAESISDPISESIAESISDPISESIAEIVDKPEIKIISIQVKETPKLSVEQNKFVQKTFLWQQKIEEKKKEKRIKASQIASSSSSSSSSSSVAKMIEDEKFSEFALERISELSPKKLGLLEKIVNKEFGICFEEVKSVVLKLNGTISNIGNGSSHYKISLYNYSKMIIKKQEEKSLIYQGTKKPKKSGKSSLAKGQIVKPHGKSHSSGELSYFNLGCVADVFHRAGVTKEVVKEAIELEASRRVMRVG